ncbi:hypothetical protein KAR91_26995 [Candidatus Pacearchaeota archaeon]|nr:hypothetical protein [Candidatus Pacearchaeota archaeon]
MTKQEHETKMLELYKKALEAKDFQIAFQVMAVLSQGLSDGGANGGPKVAV